MIMWLNFEMNKKRSIDDIQGYDCVTMSNSEIKNAFYSLFCISRFVFLSDMFDILILKIRVKVSTDVTA